MRQRVLGALVIIVTFVLAGLAGPLMDRAKAAPAIDTGENNGGVIGDSVPGVGHVYGPVDQNAPLDFANQPASVPRQYVAGRLYNIQALKGLSYPQVLQQMSYYTSALGVGCQYCHNLANFAYDTGTKKVSRSMIVMTGAVQKNWVEPVKNDYPNYAVNGAVGCITCHRGNAVNAVQWNVVPAGYLFWPAKTTRQAGFVVNSMYSASRSLGVNCLFCHNSADFVSLQYYPTNQIAQRMWRMVDDINHKYLPANVAAVTCWTCHQGAKWPNQLVSSPLDQTGVPATAAHPEVHENPGAHLTAGVK